MDRLVSEILSLESQVQQTLSILSNLELPKLVQHDLILVSYLLDDCRTRIDTTSVIVQKQDTFDQSISNEQKAEKIDSSQVNALKSDISEAEIKSICDNQPFVLIKKVDQAKIDLKIEVEESRFNESDERLEFGASIDCGVEKANDQMDNFSDELSSNFSDDIDDNFFSKDGNEENVDDPEETVVAEVVQNDTVDLNTAFETSHQNELGTWKTNPWRPKKRGRKRIHHNRKPRKAYKYFKPFKCDVCLRKFETESELVTHKESGTGHDFKCEHCGKIFWAKSLLKLHIVKHYEKQFSCDVCGRTFAKEEYLTKHYNRMHSDEYAMNCSICGKTIRSGMSMHMKTHSTERPVSCEICGKTFKFISDLKQHAISHNDERNCPCSICGKMYKTPAAVRHHMACHKGGIYKGKEFNCKECGRKLSSPGSLKRHVDLKHKGIKKKFKLHQCNLCGKTIKRTDIFRQHLHKVHKIEYKDIVVDSITHTSRTEGTASSGSDSRTQVLVSSILHSNSGMQDLDSSAQALKEEKIIKGEGDNDL